MPIVYTSGDILQSSADLITIPVNCIGVAGAGLARDWKIANPKAHVAYVIACKKGKIKVNEVTLLYLDAKLSKWVMFPTKQHWNAPSQLAWVENGLKDLANKTKQLGTKSVALCRLGTGLGKLDWNDVKKLIENTQWSEEIKVFVYE